MFAAAFLCLVFPARLAVAFDNAGPAAAAAAAATFALPLLYTVPLGRAVWKRHRNWLLAAQVVLTYLPFAIFGQDWVVGLPGFLAGLILLTVRAPVSWVLFGAVLMVEAALRIDISLPVGTSVSATIWAFSVPVNTAVALFGLVRLADLVTGLHATQAERAALATTRQRLRSEGRLREAIGDRLEAVNAHATAARLVLADIPDQARSQIVDAAAVARQALAQVRVAVADDDPDPSTSEAGQPGDTMAPRVARFVLVVVLCAFSTQIVANVVQSEPPTMAAVSSVLIVIAIVMLQLHHTPSRREGSRPRAWAWTLAAQTLLSLVSFRVELTLLAMATCAAGSMLLLLRGRWAWAGFVVISFTVGMIMAASRPYTTYNVTPYYPVYASTTVAAYGLVIYGLTRLSDLAHQVEAARQDLAQMAVLHERLRVARDVHDLLGLGLSAVALKCDLIIRLIGRDDTRARDELERLMTLVARARSDMLSVTGEAHNLLSLRSELDAARDTLATADIEVRALVPSSPVPPSIDAVLATVLREAITNILRHSTAQQCTIQLSVADGAFRLYVVNDGVPTAEVSTTSGVGVRSLRVRVQALGGQLTVGPDGKGRFEVMVKIPFTA
ncbi:sensor histidine kinase [Nonomuraea sp. LPB2021202275-12-8]|uniref:sensor histidine kinase n=1 Tax=Nonomuraea sp. LPB2021202275-12-8 TaxID=3120159 RepID=UPI00300C9DBC